MDTFKSKWMQWKERDKTDKTSFFLIGDPTDALTKPTEPWDENRAREDLNATFDWADAEPRRRWIPWARAWETRPSELRNTLDEALDAIDTAWEHRDPEAHETALEGFRRTVTAILDAHASPTAESDRVLA